ncbi:MAG TPA: ABC transporter substrate-binding protein [Xanthobacteraceae bacterium]|jgi:NitT/TauT family transport system substrate-binding protein|nr:ABC transporter substrate-binding protein [Xanthobacteraceae bacterium]
MGKETPLKFVLLALAAAPILLAGGAHAADKVTVGVIPITDVAPIYLGVAKGFFTKQNLDVTLQTAQGGAELVTPVMTGQREFGFSNISSLLIAQTRGLDIVAIAAGASSTGEQGRDFGAIIAPGGSPLKSAKDLAGKTVAVNNLKNIGDTSVKAAVRKAGGDDSKIKFVELAFPDMPAALNNKLVDAAWIVEPFLTVAKEQGAKVLAWNLVDTAPDLMIAVYFTSGKYAQEHPDTVKRFGAAMNASLAYADSHADEVRAIVPTYTRISKEVIGKLTLPRWPTEMNRKSTEILADLSVKDGLVGKRPDLAAFFR